MPFDGLTTERESELNVLLRMRDLLAKPGAWCQGGAYRGDGMCLIQAAAVAAASNALLQWRVTKRIAAQLPWTLVCAWKQPGCRVVDFNDRASTTQADVLALLDRAIGAA